MKKKILFALAVIMIGIVVTGCGSRKNTGTTQKEQQKAGNAQTETKAANEGMTGETNVTGTKGMTGDMNQTGTEGMTGETNLTGTEGVTGETNLMGIEGMTGENGLTNSMTGETNQPASESVLTEEQARDIALRDVGVAEGDITGLRIKKDLENGREVYDVEFHVGQKEYDYEINIHTGEILELDHEIEG